MASKHPSKVSREREGGKRQERGRVLTAGEQSAAHCTAEQERQQGEREGAMEPFSRCQPRAGRGGPPAVPSSGTPSHLLPAELSRPPWHRAEGAGSRPCSEPLFFFSTPPSSSSSGCYIMSGCSWKPDGSDVTLGKGGGRLEGVEVPFSSPPHH